MDPICEEAGVGHIDARFALWMGCVRFLVGTARNRPKQRRPSTARRQWSARSGTDASKLRTEIDGQEEAIIRQTVKRFAHIEECEWAQ
jgi:hypothetical protein